MRLEPIGGRARERRRQVDQAAAPRRSAFSAPLFVLGQRAARHDVPDALGRVAGDHVVRDHLVLDDVALELHALAPGASAASSIMRLALAGSPSWLMPISAITSGARVVAHDAMADLDSSHGSLSDSIDDGAGRVARFESDAHDPAAARLDDVAADDGILGPVGALHEHVGLDRGDDRVRRVLVEDHDARRRRRAPPAPRRARASGVIGPSGPLSARAPIDRS